MKDEQSEKLEAIRREVERQNEEWERAMGKLARMGHEPVAVPTAVLEAVADLTKTKTPAMPHVGGIRG